MKEDLLPPPPPVNNEIPPQPKQQIIIMKTPPYSHTPKTKQNKQKPNQTKNKTNNNKNKQKRRRKRRRRRRMQKRNEKAGKEKKPVNNNNNNNNTKIPTHSRQEDALDKLRRGGPTEFWALTTKKRSQQFKPIKFCLKSKMHVTTLPHVGKCTSSLKLSRDKSACWCLLCSQDAAERLGGSPGVSSTVAWQKVLKLLAR